MSEENTIENQAPIDPELSESPELEDGELSEAELDAQSGGFAADPFAQENANFADPNKIQAKIDSSYTSYFGSTGTTRNEASSNLKSIPFNITTSFP